MFDQRQIHQGFRFHRVAGTQLPFEEDSFDVVISNHVIEHVGAQAEQRAHLAEIARVLRPEGMAYLAFPNRWQLVEPHYGLAFLSWLPRAWRTPYLRAMRRGEAYDCEPLSLKEIERLLAESGFVFRNACVNAIRTMMAAEARPSRSLRLAAGLPDEVLAMFGYICPTHVYLLQIPNAA